jgi:hypothetical protein
LPENPRAEAIVEGSGGRYVSAELHWIRGVFLAAAGAVSWAKIGKAKLIANPATASSKHVFIASTMILSGRR